MRVLVVGGGGREHAIAWACEQHGHTVQRFDLALTDLQRQVLGLLGVPASAF